LDLGQRRNPGGVHAAFRAVRAFLNWYGEEYEPQDWTNPIAKLKAPRVPQEPLAPVSLPVLRAMLATCQDRHSFTDARDKAALLCLLDTGARASEFVALDVGDVNLTTGAVLVRQGKGGRPRSVFVGAKSRRALARYLRLRPETQPGDPLWLTVESTRLTYSGLRQIVRRRAARAGVPVPSLHSFRRAFALSMLRAGADLVSLSRLLGHSGLDLIRRYARQVQDDLADVHRRSGPVDRMLALVCALRFAARLLLERG
jgi:site-specific recombinase XerD